MRISKKAQIAVEYLFILALALAIIVPGSMLFFNYSKESNEQIIAGQINQIGQNIISQSEDIYAIGRNSWVTLEVVFPDSVKDAYIVEDSELIITYETSRGITEAVFFSDVPIQGNFGGNRDISANFHIGFMNVKVESLGSVIKIYEDTN